MQYLLRTYIKLRLTKFLVSFLIAVGSSPRLDSVYKKALIVGAGPVGLSAALMLSKKGWDEIVVLERQDSVSCDPQKSYLYCLDGRGQKCTNYLGLSSQIAEQSVNGSSAFAFLHEILTTGEVRKIKTGLKSGSTETYWLPRAKLLDILLEKIKEDPKIKISLGSTFDAMEKSHNGNIFVTAKSNDIAPNVYTPNLILGCDGYKSNLRSWLQRHFKEEKRENKFSLCSLPSDAAGLHYKIISINASFPLPSIPSQPESPVLSSESDKAYAIR